MTLGSYLWLAPVGFVVGAYGTLIGAGGGFVLMPLLLLLYPTQPREVLASVSLAVVFFNALSGTVAYARARRVDHRAGLLFAAATVPGAVAGALATGLVARRAFDLVFAALLVAGGLYLAFFPLRRARGASRGWGGSVRHVLVDSSGTRHDFTFNPGLGAAVSVVVGFVSSFLGIGGGIIHVPLLANLLGFPVHVATATSHFVLAIMALVGTIAHAATGVFTPWAVATTAALAGGALGGAQLGAFLSHRLAAIWILQGLALALVLAGARIGWATLLG